MEIGSGNLKKVDIEKFGTSTCLSPLEHAVIGSSVTVPVQGKDKLLSDKSTESTITIDDLFAIDPKLATTPVGITGKKNIDKIYGFIKDQQTIITTTHREFVPKKILNREEVEIIEL